jgi:hypothetical protein
MRSTMVSDVVVFRYSRLVGTEFRIWDSKREAKLLNNSGHAARHSADVHREIVTIAESTISTLRVKKRLKLSSRSRVNSVQAKEPVPAESCAHSTCKELQCQLINHWITQSVDTVVKSYGATTVCHRQFISVMRTV